MFDVVGEDRSDVLALLPHHVGVDVREVLAGVHAVLIAEEPVRVVGRAYRVHRVLGEMPGQACAGLPVQQDATEIENHIGDGGVAHDAPQRWNRGNRIVSDLLIRTE